jgi:hypothetical protein
MGLLDVQRPIHSRIRAALPRPRPGVNDSFRLEGGIALAYGEVSFICQRCGAVHLPACRLRVCMYVHNYIYYKRT